MAFQRTARTAKLRLVADTDSQAEEVGNETIEWRICLGRDILQFVVANPEEKEQTSDGHRVCQS
jgi:hypothetical protein